MGIRVDIPALYRQLELCGQQQKLSLYFHKRLINGELPLSIGGGMAVKICMFVLRKAILVRFKPAFWPEDMRQECKEHGMELI